MVEFGDFECEHCARFARATLPALVERYVKTGRVRIAFENLFLNEHAHALPAAQAAYCAHSQGQFWPMYSLLFSQPSTLDHDGFIRDAHYLDLDLSRFDACLTGPQTPRIQMDKAEARRLQLTAVPAFAIGPVFAKTFVRPTTRLKGALPLDEFVAALDAVLGSSSAPGTPLK